jgi:exopolyphosphatase/guanosine-5'-triphosphate,3'-diphosphate pyrophosphatase
MSRFKASIDLGTNTARLLLGSECEGRLLRHHITRRITRLGGGFSKETGISDDAAQRTVVAMTEFAAIIEEYKVSELRAVATSAVRDAANRDEFCRSVRSTSGIELEVISGEEEAFLTLSGMISGLDVVPETMLVFDVGGGSTEYTVATADKILYTKSLPLGVVRLTEGKGTPAAISEKIERELNILISEMNTCDIVQLFKGAILIATAGTATTLAAIDIGLTDYDYSQVNNHIMDRSRIMEMYHRLVQFSPSERLKRIPGLEKGREDLIIAGIILTLKSMEMFGSQSLKVSDFGLLEGIMLSMSTARKQLT